MIAVSVITPVWNRADLTLRFLMSNWTHYRAREDVEFIVVDNASSDGTSIALARCVSQFDGRLRTHRNTRNEGFGPGHNKGAELARGEVLIFLSNDVEILGDYIQPIQVALAEEPRALVGPQMLRHDTGWNTFQGRTIAYLAGHCVACKRATWKELGGWDERYVPCDYEDIDLSYAALQKGIPLLEVPLPLHHMFGQSAAALSGGREAITRKSRAKFVEKWGLG